MMSRLSLKSRFRSVAPVLTLALVALLTISLATLITSYNYPEQTSEEVVTASITQRMDMDYVAFIRSSLIYENRTVLMPGEPIYTKLFEGLNITYKYLVNTGKGPASVRGSYRIYLNISSPVWGKEFLLRSGTVDELMNSPGVIYFNYTYLRDYIAMIEKEVGSSRTYTFTLIFDVRAEVMTEDSSRSYSLPMIPLFRIYYDTAKPTIDVSTEGLERTYVDSYKLVKTTRLPFLWLQFDVITYRTLLVVLSMTLAGSITILTILMTLGRASRVPPLLRIESKYRDLIVSGELEQVKHVVAVVRLKSLTDLVKVASTRRKPIVRFDTAESVRYAVVDSDVTYTYEAAKEK
ncbi:MAG: DUF5305 family protein [Zestosphaera sp.]